jgi:hypothetical protein
MSFFWPLPGSRSADRRCGRLRSASARASRTRPRPPFALRRRNAAASEIAIRRRRRRCRRDAYAARKISARRSSRLHGGPTCRASVSLVPRPAGSCPRSLPTRRFLDRHAPPLRWRGALAPADSPSRRANAQAAPHKAGIAPTRLREQVSRQERKARSRFDWASGSSAESRRLPSRPRRSRH